jgi:hypothetical protein
MSTARQIALGMMCIVNREIRGCRRRHPTGRGQKRGWKCRNSGYISPGQLLKTLNKSFPNPNPSQPDLNLGRNTTSKQQT